MTNQQDKLYKQLIEAGRDVAKPDEAIKQRVLQASLRALSSDANESSIDNDAVAPTVPSRLVPDASCGSGDAASREAHCSTEPPRRRRCGRLLMATHRRSVRYGAAAAAAVILAVFGLWPNRSGAPGEKWWLAPPAALAETIARSARAVRTRAVTCRERLTRLGADGRQLGCTTARFYTSHDSYRRDYYDEDSGQVRETQWYTPEGTGMQQTCVDFVKRTYRVLHGPGSYDDRDPVERICWLVNFRDKAEKMLGTKQIEGREAVGFQIRASQFGDNPQENRVRVWFDTQTRLTVLTESEYRELDGGVTVEVQDQINWNPGPCG